MKYDDIFANLPTDKVFWAIAGSWRCCCVCKQRLQMLNSYHVHRLYGRDVLEYGYDSSMGRILLAYVCCGDSCWEIFKLNLLAYEQSPSYWVI